MIEFKELFIEHYEILEKYKTAKRKYDNLLEKKAMLIIQTQPKASNISNELIKGGTVSNKFDDFVQRLEKLDPEIQQARNERDLQEYFLKKKELELKDSDDVLDSVYYLKNVKKIKIKYIARQLKYSYQRIYQLKNDIDKRLEKIRI